MRLDVRGGDPRFKGVDQCPPSAESPDEIAPLVVFLVSPLATAITGAALRIDGGVVRAIV